MRIPNRLLSALLTLILLAPALPAFAQKRNPRPKPAPKPSVAQPISFDNLLSVDSYKIYIEIRNVGQLISSSSVNELLEPVLKLAAPPKEFKTAVKWLTAHADSVTTSRMMFATSPTAKNVPNVLVAIEFDTAEEAAKFEPQLNEVLPKVLPPSKPDASPTPGQQPVAGSNSTSDQPKVEVTPNFYVMRSGALVFVTSSPLTLKNLRPRNSKALAEDSNFRTAYDRFTSESVFAFINMKAIDQEEKELQEKAAEERKTLEAASKEISKLSPQPEEVVPNEEPSPNDPGSEPSSEAVLEVKEQPAPPLEPAAIALSQLASAFFGGFMDAKWPEAIAFAGNLDASSFDVRALLVTSLVDKPAAIPFFPALVSGPPLVPESPSILPADTELFVTFSLDLPQMHAVLSKPVQRIWERKEGVEHAAQTEPESPFAFIEKQAGIKISSDLLPLLGNEVVFSMPVAVESSIPAAEATPTPAATVNSGPYDVKVTMATSQSSSPTIALSLRDKEGLRALLPKLIEALGFKGASALAQTEKREDTEIVTYANALSYAFIGNFLVVSPDVKNIKHVVDSYLKRETLSSDINFKNSTRWQSRQLQGQVYVSPSLMESYKKWANEPTTLMSDQTREFLTRLTVVAEPVSYSLSNEGAGPLHQVRIPKNLLLMAIAGMSAETNQPPMIANERSAMGTLYFIAHTEFSVKTEKGAYATLDELIALKKIQKGQLEGNGYRIDLTITSNGFEAVAVPLEYGKTGKMSYFIDETILLRGGDHGGGPATVADKPIQPN